MGTDTVILPKYFKDKYGTYSKYYLVDGHIRVDEYIIPFNYFSYQDIIYIDADCGLRVARGIEDWDLVEQKIYRSSRDETEITEEEWEWINIK